MKKVCVLLVFITSVSFGQTGPAGVGNFDGSNGQKENIIWLDASTLGLADGNPVLTWPDLSGNGNDLIQQGADPTPLFETNGLFNGNHPAVRFDGSERYLTLADNNDLDNTLSGITVIAVVYNATLDGAARGIYSKRISSGSNQSYSAFTYTTQRLNFDIHNGSNQRLASTIGLTTTSDYIFTNTYRNNSQQIFLQSDAAGSASITGNISNTGSPLILGALNNDYGTYFDGDIAELIFYRQGLNDAERIIVENYLALKYNITLGSNAYYGVSAAFDAAFDNEIMGIGTANGIEKFSQSGLSDALQIDEVNGTLNSANEFLMFGHDNTAHADGVTANITVDPGVLDSRWARSWFLEVNGSVSGALRFDFGTAGLPFSGDASDYVLLYRATTADNYTRVLVDSYTVENGDQLVANLGNLSLPTGYYTIGEGEQLTTNSWYSYQTGDWNDPLTWTTISNGSLREPVTGGIPAPGDNVTILSGRTVTMDSDDNDGVNLTVNGRLDVGNTSGHNFFNILGNGTISIAGDVSNNSNFPSGSTTVFADSIVGGTVEIVGTGLNLNQDRLFNNVIINLTGATDVATLVANFTINGDLTIDNGTLQINDNITATSRSITTYGNVQINATGEINVGTANARHEFNFYGDFLNQGRAEFTNRVATDYNNEATDGIVDANFLSPTNSQTIQCFGVTNFYRIEVDKGTDQTYILDIEASDPANFNLFGPADYGHGSTAQLTTNDNALGLLRGTVRLNTNVDVPVLNNTGNYNISEAARLWVNGGSAAKPTGTAIVPYGTIQLSGGTIDAPVNSGITTRANGNIVVSGGIMTVRQIRTSVNGPTNIGGYTQIDGEVFVTGGSISNEYYAFSLTYPGNTFTMLGGTLTVAGAPTGATTGGIFIASDVSNQDVKGGTVVMEISNNNDFKLASRAPFWNVIMRKSGGSGTEVDLITGASGTGGNTTNIINPDLRILNDLTIETGVTFDHNGNDVEIASNFIIQTNADYVWDNGKRNTTTINGTDHSLLGFYNRDDVNTTEQRFWNLIIDKPVDKTVSLASSKTVLTGTNNHLLRIDGDAFKLLGGIVDQGFHTIRVYTDTLVNYGVLTIYNPANATPASTSNGNNDQIKFRPDDFVLLTNDDAIFGNVRLNSTSQAITLRSNVRIDYLEYLSGRIDLNQYNLKVDRIELNPNAQADWNGCGGCFSVEDMLIMNGSASAGGFSLYVPDDGLDPWDGDAIFDFPIGVGTDGLDVALSGGNSKYTPASVTLSGVTDDGYITIRPVDQVLATTDGSGGDILSYYWKVDFEDFTTPPTVQYQFTYYDADLDGSGNEASFVAGKVLEINPYSRRYEDDNTTGVPGVVQNEGVNTGLNTITFNGDADSGFTLEEAAYTAGESGRFVGAPQIFYSRNTSQTNWTNTNAWSLSRDGGSAGDYPRDGDIAILTRDNGGAGDPTTYGAGVFQITNAIGAINIAKLVFDDYDPVNNNWISGCPRVIFDVSGGYNAYNSFFGTVEVTDRHIDGSVPQTTHGAVIQYNVNSSYTGIFPGGDFGDFNQDENALVIYTWDGGTGTTTLSTNATEYPLLWFEGGNSSNRIIQFPDVDVTVNGKTFINGNMLIRVNDDASRTLTFKNNVEIGSGCCGSGFFEFEGNSTEDQTVIIEGNLSFNGTNGGQLRLVNNSASNTHKLTVMGDITVPGTGTINMGDGSNSVIELELGGEGTNSFTNSGSVTLHRIIMNKGNSKDNTFSFEDSFTLNGLSNGSTKAIEIQNGTLIFNDAAINVDLTTGGDDFSIPSAGGLQITQGTANVSGDDSGISLNGLLRINGGTLNMDDAVGNGNNYIEYSASGNAVLEVSSGTLDVGSQIRPITSANTGILKYRQTGGDVRIGTQAGTENTRGMLQIYNPGSEFTYTGGTLTIERHQTSPSISALYLDPDVSDVTNSTITIFNTNTPAGQTNFGINSTISLDNLVLNGTNSPTARIEINPLTINNGLTINSGATLNGNGINLIVGGDMDNDGTYNAQNNETIFNTTTNQSLTGSGTNNFFRFTKEEIGTLNLTNAISVGDLFTISDGVVDDNGFSINLAADAVIDGTHVSVGGNGLVFNGAANQELRRSTAGTGQVGVITIDNNNGVTIPDGNGYNFDISGGLRLDGGVFNIGGAYILFGTNASITPVTPFSVTNMIQTNSSFVDSGIGKQFTAGFNQDFTFPVGQAFYTPVSFDFGTPGNTFGATPGVLTVRPSNEFHPTINDGNELTSPNDISNVLQYYWTLEAGGVNGMIADMSLVYDQSDALSLDAGFNESDYIAARILTFNNPTSEINKFTDAAAVDESTNIITFNFPGVGDNSISGDYFAGIDDAIPNNVATYIAANGGGNVNLSSSYDVTTPLPTDGVPPSGAVIRIPSGNTIVLNQNDIRLYRTIIEDGGILEIDNTSNHRLGILEGTGTMRIVSDGINANLPAFSGDFLTCTGGGLEYDGSGSYSILSGISSLRNLTLSGSGDRNFPNNNVTICEDLIVDGPNVSNPNNRSITVENDLELISGNLLLGTGAFNVSNDVRIVSGILDAQNGGNTVLRGNVLLDGGTFNIGSAGRVFIRGNLSRTSGGITGSGTGNIRFDGSSVQTISGDFTNLNAFYRIEIRNSAGLVFNDPIEFTSFLILTQGIISGDVTATGTISPSIGRSNSFINGKVSRTLSSVGNSFTFPIGSINQWRPATVNNVSTGGLTWEAQYFEGDPTSDPLVDNLNATNPGQILTISSGEYWKISDGNGAPSGVTATVGLSWGVESDVSSVSSEREELEVMVWNDGLSSWDNLGGGSFSGGHAESGGTFSATTTASFSENIFTLGSGDLANPLPIVLKSFTGRKEANNHILKWLTTSEINNDYFELQRSADGLIYESLAVIEGNGTTLEEITYNYIDSNPLIGKNYYQLVQVDYDGTTVIVDKKVLLEFVPEDTDLQFSIFPNPTNEFDINLRIKADSRDNVVITMFDLYGKKVMEKVVETYELFEDLSLKPDQSLHQGIYLITVEQFGIKKSKRVIITK
ncbi:T9SS type A sorting domain-containing protein [Fulvivirga sp.]|uniref:LamG-like jellyroll fold domain-containing protein n=2 Tax=Fulvivirga sp. TaxID=1931237 RepID=UPI0032EFFBCA